MVETFLQNLYVDDCTNSLDDLNTAITFCGQLSLVLSDASFELLKFVTNSKELWSCILLQKDNANETGKSNNHCRKVPGINWDTDSDQFAFEFGDISQEATKS